MLIDQDVAFVAPAKTYRILKAAGRLDRWNRKPSKKGSGFGQPTAAHKHCFSGRLTLSQRRQDRDPCRRRDGGLRRGPGQGGESAGIGMPRWSARWLATRCR
jgi:hypothetical protein